MLVYGVISPHPPLIIPDIGGNDILKVQHTVDALQDASVGLGKSAPDKIVIISPHDTYGFQVPLYYLGQHLRDDIEIEEILVTHPSYRLYYEQGIALGRQAHESPERYAVIASGDLSHVLKKDGPYGFNPAGPLLDNIIVDAVQSRDADALLNIDQAILDPGAECGLRSILFLLGALSELEVETNVLSYEGPFGVGYLVASFEVKP